MPQSDGIFELNSSSVNGTVINSVSERVLKAAVIIKERGLNLSVVLKGFKEMEGKGFDCE